MSFINRLVHLSFAVYEHRDLSQITYFWTKICSTLKLVQKLGVERCRRTQRMVMKRKCDGIRMLVFAIHHLKKQ